MSFLYGFSFGCSSIKVYGGIFHNQLFWNSVLALFAQFSIIGCKVFFHQVLVLKHLFTVGSRISLMVGKCICFFPYDGKIYMTVAFLFWVVHLTKRTGGLFHNQLFWNSVLALFAQFFLHRL